METADLTLMSEGWVERFMSVVSAVRKFGLRVETEDGRLKMTEPEAREFFALHLFASLQASWLIPIRWKHRRGGITAEMS
jgi:hypothetical protein